MGELAEIEHVFSPPAARPSDTLAYAFSGVIVFVFLWFLVGLGKLGLNQDLWSKIDKSASFLFISSIAGVISIYIWFWTKGNIVYTMQFLGIFSIFFLFSLKVFFRAHANAKN